MSHFRTTRRFAPGGRLGHDRIGLCRAVDNALTLFRVWPIENVGAIFGHASAAAQRITCLVAGFKRLFCSIYE